jgi:sialidase-1
LVSQYLKERFPDTQFEFINAGISSTGSTPGAFRLQDDVFAQGRIDLFFEEAAVNDRTNGFNNIAQIRGMEGIVRHMRIANPLADIVMMHCVDPEKIEEYRKGMVPTEISNHELVAAHYKVNTVNLSKEVTARIDAGEFTWKEDFRDLHPSPFGHQVYAATIIALLEKAYADASTAQPDSHKLPTAIDPFSYAAGRYVPVAQAKIVNGWRLDEKWVPKDGAGTRKQYVNIPALIGEISGAKLTFDFKGSAVGICIASGPDAGIIEYRIDGGKFKQLDLYTQWSGSLHLPWYLMLDDQLKNKRHTLELMISSTANPKSKGNACRVLHFLVNQLNTTDE